MNNSPGGECCFTSAWRIDTTGCAANPIAGTVASSTKGTDPFARAGTGENTFGIWTIFLQQSWLRFAGVHGIERQQAIASVLAWTCAMQSGTAAVISSAARARTVSLARTITEVYARACEITILPQLRQLSLRLASC